MVIFSESIQDAECLGLNFFSLCGHKLIFSQLIFSVVLLYCSILPDLMLHLFDFLLLVHLFHVNFGYLHIL